MRHAVLALFAALALIVTACSKEPEPPPPTKMEQMKDKLGKAMDQAAEAMKQTAAHDQVVAKYRELRTALAQVKDEASAKAAKVQLQGATAELDKAKAALAQHGQMLESVKQKLGPTLDQAKAQLREQVTALQRDPQVNAAMGDVLTQVQALLK